MLEKKNDKRKDLKINNVFLTEISYQYLFKQNLNDSFHFCEKN